MKNGRHITGRLLAAMLCIVLIATMIPVFASAASKEDRSIIIASSAAAAGRKNLALFRVMLQPPWKRSGRRYGNLPQDGSGIISGGFPFGNGSVSGGSFPSAERPGKVFPAGSG